jgi:hypothetical protein
MCGYAARVNDVRGPYLMYERPLSGNQFNAFTDRSWPISPKNR